MQFRNTLVILYPLLFWSLAFGQTPALKFHDSGVSDRDLMGLGNPIAPVLQSFAERHLSNSAPDTLRILAIRVEFQPPTNSLTTGDGTFDLATTSDVVIDPTPHDRKYFEAQLSALANYYKKVSRGNLIIAADVYPQNMAGSYTASQEMRSYISLDSEEALDQRLAALLQEGFQIAGETDAIDFSQYDSFILFHAGVGNDFALPFDPTPQDIPSVFLDFASLRENLGNGDPNYAGIPVNNGSFFIRDGMILPETQNQEGFQIGLLGTMALMFGHQLGLPNLFNSDNGLPGIGVFGLMDQGSGNFDGLIPAEPCAWSKIFLGWETPIEITNGEDLSVAVASAANPNKIYKIPIDSQEYFLIENRKRDLNNDSLTVAQTADGARVEFVWDSKGQRILFEAAGVITQVGEYDFGLPGSGILIWHIDERVIAANFASNRVNADANHRGVDLEEADGAQDIGQVYGFLSPGAGAEAGVFEDMFWGSNDINILVNSAPAVAFTPFSKPNSSSNLGADSHIYMTDFSEPDTVMTFSVRNEISQSGFPQFTGSTIFTNSPMMADLDADGIKEVILSSLSSTEVFVWKMDGAKFIANQDSAQIEKLNGQTETVPVAVFAIPPGNRGFSPALASINNRNVVVAVTDQVVAAYLPEDKDLDGRADPLFIFQPFEPVLTSPLIISGNGADDQIVIGTGNGNIIIISGDGTESARINVSSGIISGLALLPPNKVAFTTLNGDLGLAPFNGTGFPATIQTNGTFSKGPVVADLNQDGNFDIIAVTDRGDIYVIDSEGNNLLGFPKITDLPISSQVILGDIDDDNFFEMIFIADHKIYAFNHFGNLENNFPIQISGGSSLAIASSPILADLDGDRIPEIIVGSNLNQLVAFHSDGRPVDGFPLSTGGSVNSTPFVADLENDGDLDLAVAADDGFLYIWDLPVPFDGAAIQWGGLFKDAQHSNANLDRLQSQPATGQLMPENRVYNYPNPTEGNETTIRYTLNFSAQVNIKIFDLAGELVDEFPAPGFPQTENEVNWSVQNIESGVYLARVEAIGDDGKKDMAIIKIAVVK